MEMAHKRVLPKRRVETHHCVDLAKAVLIAELEEGNEDSNRDRQR